MLLYLKTNLVSQNQMSQSLSGEICESEWQVGFIKVSFSILTRGYSEKNPRVDSFRLPFGMLYH